MKRKLVRHMQAEHGVSERRACRLAMIYPASHRYRSRKGTKDLALRLKLKELAYSRPRYGYMRLWVLLRREGWQINRKYVYRLYREENLQIRIKRRKKRASEVRVPPQVAENRNERWAIDFVHDQLQDGRRFRVLTGIDHYSRTCVVLAAAERTSAMAVTAALDAAIAAHGAPRCITVDNGSEFIAREFDAWAYGRGIQIDYTRPGHPTDNGMIESLNGSLRDECLNLHWFGSVGEAQAVLEAWKMDYNTERPHSSLGYLAPSAYMARRDAVWF